MRDNAVKIVIAVTVAIVITSNATTLIFKCDWTSPNKPKHRHNVQVFSCITIRTNVNPPKSLFNTYSTSRQIQIRSDGCMTNALSHTYAINNAFWCRNHHGHHRHHKQKHSSKRAKHARAYSFKRGCGIQFSHQHHLHHRHDKSSPSSQ